MGFNSGFKGLISDLFQASVGKCPTTYTYYYKLAGGHRQIVRHWLTVHCRASPTQGIFCVLDISEGHKYQAPDV